MSKQQTGIIRRFLAYLGRTVLNLIKTIFKFTFGIIAMWVVSLLIIDALNAPEPLPDSAALVIAPTGAIVEQLTLKPALQKILEEDGQQEILLRDLVETINRAAYDPRINSLVLYPEEMHSSSFTTLRTIGKAIENFKSKNKQVVAVADNYSQNHYFLASFADTIYINPIGGVEIFGIGSVRPYFKQALEKLKINMHVFKVGTFKDAVEPFTRNNMSETSRLHNSEWINELWQAYTQQVETRRELPIGALDDYIDNIDNNLATLNGNASQLALDSKLVDKVVTRPERTAELIKLAGSNGKGTFAQVHYRQYLQHIDNEKSTFDNLKTGNSSPRVGVLIAKGEILDGEQAPGVIGGNTLAKLIRQVSEDNTIKALVLRIDSPGGSANASEVIRQELMSLKEKGIPIVVSMGSVAASGGYWIAANADQIWASPTTITGSIGVFGIIPTFEKSFSALGIHFDQVGSTTLATARTTVLPMSPKAARVIQTTVDGIYQRFLNLVAEGRNSTPNAIDDVAQGRVWTGRRAHELGLVDQLGGLDQAIAAAAALAKLDDYEVEYVEKPLSFEELLIKELSKGGVKLANWFGIKELLPGSLMTTVSDSFGPLNNSLKSLNDPNSIYLNCYDCPIAVQ